MSAEIIPAKDVCEPQSGLVVVIPARDEEATVGRIVRRIKDICSCEVVVIDDQSSDATTEKALEAGATVLPLALHLNAWGAMQAGFRYALERGADICVTFDADGQHRPEVIPQLAAEIKSGRAEVVIGACPGRGSTARKFIWTLFRRVTGFNYRDLTSGLRAYNATAASLLLSPQATQLDYQDVGVLLLLREYGLRITEVFVPMDARSCGCSRVFNSWFAVLRYLMKSFVLCFTKLFLPRAAPETGEFK